MTTEDDNGKEHLRICKQVGERSECQTYTTNGKSGSSDWEEK